MSREVCRECGAEIPANATRCPRCGVELPTAASRKRVAVEILLYISMFFVVMIGLLVVIASRKIAFFAALFQGVLPFVIFGILTFIVVRFWKRS